MARRRDSLQQNEVVADDEIVSRWPLQDSLADAVGTHDLSNPRGDPTFTTEENRDAIALTGDVALRASRGGHEELSQLGTDSDGLSLSLWVYFDTVNGGTPAEDSDTGYHSLIRNDTGYRVVGQPVSAEDAVNIRFSISPYGDSAAEGYRMPDDTDVLVPVGEWHHVGIRAAPNSFVEIFVDGISEYVDENMSGFSDPNEDFWTDVTIGSWYGKNPEEWDNLLNGKLADIRLYGTPLSPAQHGQVFDNTKLDGEGTDPESEPTPSPTPTPAETPSPTPTATPTDYGFQEARQEVQVQPIGTDLLVLTGIPNADGKPAVTTTEYQLVDADTARDAFVTFTHGQSNTGFDWDSQLEYARTMRTKHGMAEVWSQAANIGWDALAAYAMTQINPAAGIGPVLEVLNDSTSWVLQEAADPYEEAMSKQSQWTITYRNLEDDISQAESLTEMNDTMFGFVSTANSLVGYADDLSSVVSAANSAYQASNSFTTAAAAGTAATTSAAYYAAIGILVSEGVGLISSGFEQNAKLSAIGHAYSTTRIPVIERIIELEDERTANTLSPCGAWELAYLTMNHHYMGAFANQGMHKYASKINESTVGGVWDALVNVGEVASVLDERASDYQWGGAAAHYDYGERTQRAMNLTENSINLEEKGSPTPLGVSQ